MQGAVRQLFKETISLVGGLAAGVGVGVDDAGCVKRVCCDTGVGTQSEENLARCGRDGRCNRDWLGWE